MNLNDQLEGSTDLYRIINSGPTELRGSGHKLMNINDPPGPTDLRRSGHKLMYSLIQRSVPDKQSKRRRLVFKTGVIIYIQNYTFKL